MELESVELSEQVSAVVEPAVINSGYKLEAFCVKRRLRRIARFECLMANAQISRLPDAGPLGDRGENSGLSVV